MCSLSSRACISLSLESKRLVDKLGLSKESFDPPIRRHLHIVSKDMGVSSSLGSAAPGHATAFRGSSNEDVRQRDAVINNES